MISKKTLILLSLTKTFTMKQQLLKSILLLFILSFQTNQAQENIPFQITSGFNADVIANGQGSALTSTTIGVDVVNYCFMSADFQPTTAAPPAFALPINGQINNVANPTIGFQLGDYSNSNSLRLVSVNNTGTLTFGNSMTASKLYILVTSGSGASIVTASIQFSDNSTQVITGNSAPDWFNSTALPVVTSGIGRVNRTNNTIENPAGNPRLYQMTLNVLPANQSKLITGIQFTKTSTAEGVFNAFAVTAETLPSCPQPINLAATTTAVSATVNWNEPAVIPTNGYDYYFATTNTPPIASTTPTGNVPSTQTFVNFPDLATGVTFYVWVRSNCDSSTQSNWSFVSFTTGQIEVIYNDGDLPTLYNNTANINSTTTCPGALSVTIPIGYQIASTTTSYQMTAAGGAWQTEQRSRLFCTTTNLGETALYNGPQVDGPGVASYNRANLVLANGATGTVNFELRTWRTWGGTGCGTNYNKVDTGTWKIIVTYELIPCSAPDAPLAENQSFCGSATVADLTASNTSGGVLAWYADETSETALENTTILTSGNYFVSQILNDCESERTQVSVSINEIPSLPQAESQTFCGNSTFADLSVTGIENATFSWYENLTSEMPLLMNTTVESGAYFVTQTINGCESDKLEVVIVILAQPEILNVDNQSFCGSAIVDDLIVNSDESAQINWYQNAADTEALTSDAILSTGIYYVTQTINGCESEKTEVSVEILETPTPPAYDGTLIFNQGTLLNEIQIDVLANMVVQWYVMSEEGNYIPVESNTLIEETTYYVTQSFNGCESDFLMIEVESVLSSHEFETSKTSIYPNPVEETLFIKTDLEIENLRIINMLGQIVLEVKNPIEKSISVEILENGTYLLEIKSKNSNTEINRFVKK